ncbi:MAG: STAS domain-containing protein [Spirochaetes bacterium]|nr:STAS domain-containing protein [Spirochaetota bacterium]
MLESTDTNSERTYLLHVDLVSSNIKRLEEEFSKFIAEDTRDIIIDLKNVAKIDSMSIATLIRIKKKLSEKDRTLKLINPNDGVLRVLDLSGLETYLLD